jgi:hypothetical protein
VESDSMMIRLILDRAADECVQECMKLSCAANVGTVIQEALTAYRCLLQGEEALGNLLSHLEQLTVGAPNIEVTEKIYDEPRTV